MAYAIGRFTVIAFCFAGVASVGAATAQGILASQRLIDRGQIQAARVERYVRIVRELEPIACADHATAAQVEDCSLRARSLSWQLAGQVVGAAR